MPKLVDPCPLKAYNRIWSVFAEQRSRPVRLQAITGADGETLTYCGMLLDFGGTRTGTRNPHARAYDRRSVLRRQPPMSN